MVPFPGMFYWRNKTKSIPLFILISLSVAIIGVVATLTGSILNSIYTADARPFEYFTILVSKDLMISDSVLSTLANNQEVDSLVPFLDSSVRVTGLFGSERRRVYALDDLGMASVLSRLDLRLVEGHLPSPGTYQIALHESIMKSRGLRVGDLVGQEIDSTDYLWGMFEVTGVLAGPIPIGIASLDYFKRHWVYDLGENAYALLAFPKAELAAMNSSLHSSIGERLIIRDLDFATESYKAESQEMDLLLWILNIAIISIISLSMGMLNTIHFLSRMKEYGVLFLIGLNLPTLLRRTLAEVLILSFTGFLGGTTISWLLTWFISTRIFAPRGIPIQVYSLRYILFTLPVPVFLALFSFLTIRRHISKMDAVAIVEGRE